jgi:integral membrane sensor domain MASE1
MLRALVDRGYASPLVRAGVLGVACFAGAELGHLLSLKNNEQAFATIWPPTGLLLAALVRNPPALWPALLVAASAGNLASDVLLHDRSIMLTLGFCVASCAESCTGAWLLRRLCGAPFTLARMKDVVGLACWSALISTMVGATIGAGLVKLALGDTSYWSAWQVWWIADASGVLVFAPVVLTWSPILLRGAGLGRMVEAVALFVGMIMVSQGVYGELLPTSVAVPIFILPFLLWAGLRFGPSGAAGALLVVGVIGIWNVSHGRGPFAIPTDPGAQLMRAQAALCVVSLSLLALAATVAERKEAEQQKVKVIGELEKALSEIKTLQGLIPVCAWCKKIRNDQGFWQRLEDYFRAHTDAEFTHAVCPVCLEKELAALGAASPERKDG